MPFFGAVTPLYSPGFKKCGVPKFTPYNVDSGEHAGSDYRQSRNAYGLVCLRGLKRHPTWKAQRSEVAALIGLDRCACRGLLRRSLLERNEVR